MKRFIYVWAALSAFALAPASQAFDATYYLVRHAEKQSDGTHDPALTTEGVERANAIAKTFHGVKFDAIYSTNYKRTRATAAPAATQAGLDVILYDPKPGKFEAFINEMKEKDGVYLIVGHSNTTPVVASALSGQSLPELDERQYDHIYVVTRNSSGEATLKINYSNPRTP